MVSRSEYHGIVVVDKPAGMTSHDVVNVARKLFQTKRIGHTGTLDPDATGVLVLCLGQATRLAEYLSASQKHYHAEVTFGITTNTQDASGEILHKRDASDLTRETVDAVLPRFRGNIQQIPPMVSAVHYQGKRLYELAREGITVERAPRTVEISHLEMTHWQPGDNPTATLEITCSTGTYIRTLAADIGDAVETGAIMATLRRLWVGDSQHHFALENASTLDQLQERAATEALAEIVLSMRLAVASWTQAILTPEQVTEIKMGRFLPLDAVTFDVKSDADAPIALLDEAGTVCALGKIEADTLRPVKVLLEQ